MVSTGETSHYHQHYLHLVLVGLPLNPGAELSTSAQNVGKTYHYIHHTLLWIMHLPIGSQWIHHQYLHILTITILTVQLFSDIDDRPRKRAGYGRPHDRA